MGSGGSLSRPGGSGLKSEHARDHTCARAVQQFPEHLKSTVFIHHKRIPLGIGFQADRNSQGFHAGQVFVPELNLGQLTTVLRSRYLVDVQLVSKMQGKPFKSSEIADAVRQRVKG